jgi:hypothetical protein
MKNVITIFFLLLTLIGKAQTDEKLIKQTVEAEATAFNTGNGEKSKSLWKYDPKSKQVILIVSGVGGSILQFSGEVIAAFNKYSPTSTTSFQNYDYQIKVSGSLAFARYSVIENHNDGTKLHAFRTDFLEKVGKEWKIIGVTKQEYIPK